jgi:hypothetical protein
MFSDLEIHDVEPDFTEYEKKRLENREQYRRALERWKNLSEADLREMGDTPEEWLRWALRKQFPPTSS